MINPNEIVTIIVVPNTMKYYTNLGYNLGDPIRFRPPQWKVDVYVKDLQERSNIKVTRTCDICGKVDQVKYFKKQFLYCKKCSASNKSNKRKDKFCPDCGKQITRKSNYCLQCAKKRQRGENSVLWKPDKIRNCSICGNKINKPRPDAVGVCKSCYKGDYHRAYKPELIQQYCSICGKSLDRHYKYLSNPIVCSKCNKGIHHVNYNHDKPEEDRIERRKLPGIMDFIKKVRNRDKVCKKCNSNKQLEVHHIKSWKSYPELRLDPDNGILLCKNCHIEFHSIYGLHDTTLSDLIEYLIGDYYYEFNYIKMEALA